ncbi:hypothetical protein [Bartonella florencae]|uniref:hypothetical protein n=1 Tax=Bartonella florencae TaxID=928210 RepID=UPI0002F91CD9|nr:hypothetical protein [Bartonella florencae]
MSQVVSKLFSISSILINFAHTIFSIYTKYKEQEERKLGPKLELKSISQPRSDNVIPSKKREFKILAEPLVHLHVTFYNPTKQMIRLNYIWIDKKSPFEFAHVSYPKSGLELHKQKENIFIKTQKKHVNLITPKLNPIQNEWYNLFSIESESELTFLLIFKMHNPSEIQPINIIVEHTSPNYPTKTLKPHFYLGSFCDD